MGESRSRESASLYPPVGLEWTRDDAQRWTSAARAADETTHSRTPRASPPTECTGALSGHCRAADTADRADARQAGRTQGRPVAGRPCTSCVTMPDLLASGDAWRTAAGDSGTGRSQRSVDDAALYAPEPGRAGRRDSAPGAARRPRAGGPRRTESWRRGGDGPRGGKNDQ